MYLPKPATVPTLTHWAENWIKCETGRPEADFMDCMDSQQHSVYIAGLVTNNLDRPLKRQKLLSLMHVTHKLE